MRRRRLAVTVTLVAIAAAGALTTALAAGEAPVPVPVPMPVPDLPSESDSDPRRAVLLAALDAELDVVRAARATVDDKHAVRAAARADRVRVAYKLLRGSTARLWVDPAERGATARRRAGVRIVLEHDRGEVGELATEADALAVAEARLIAERATAATIALPPTDLARPAAGAIVRRFGTLRHERSGALLSRRGLDFAVADGAVAHAVADGTIRYAGPIRGLDHGVVIDHAGFWSVTAKLALPTLTIGDTVRRGDPVGAAASHRVYLEVRVPVGPGGLPVDPEPLLTP